MKKQILGAASLVLITLNNCLSAFKCKRRMDLGLRRCTYNGPKLGYSYIDPGIDINATILNFLSSLSVII